MQANNVIQKKFKVNLFMLGCQIEVICKFEKCSQEIEQYFSHFVQKKFETPDIKIFCDWDSSNKYLFRARPPQLFGTHLEGISYQLPNEEVKSWIELNPPLPPNILNPIKDRFVGLHAGAVVNNYNEAMIIIGPRGVGKTTTTTRLVNEYGYGLLTEETVYVNKRTVLAEPFHREIRARIKDSESGKIVKKTINVDELYNQIHKKSARLEIGIFLEPTAYYGVREISQGEALRRLISNHRDVGCNDSEAVITLLLMSQELKFFVVNYKNYNQLCNEVIHDLNKIFISRGLNI